MISAIIQARMGSTRLPDKVLMDVGGHPMLWHMIERLKPAKNVDEIILAIPNTKENDILEQFAKENNLKYFRGSENDVLARYYETAKAFKVDVIIRITSDCPLIDPEIVDKVIEEHLQSKADYTSNIQARTYPKGMDAEAVNFAILERAFKEAVEPADREHVTLYIRRNPQIFKQADVKNDKDLFFMRWTVDGQRDLDFVREVYKRLYSKKKIFLMKDILEVLEKEPQLLEINKEIKRKPI